ncbi:hypothetical protein Hanom_Chr09g00823321 [Helianthus anomalus]
MVVRVQYALSNFHHLRCPTAATTTPPPLSHNCRCHCIHKVSTSFSLILYHISLNPNLFFCLI